MAFMSERTTRHDPKPIIFYITEDMWTIIKKWRNQDRSPNAYLFPIINDSLDPLRQFELVNTFTGFINIHMLKIGNCLGIDK